MEKLANGWSITDWKAYIIDGLLLQLGIRIVMSLLSGVITTGRSHKPFRTYLWIYSWHCFKGFHPPDGEDARTHSDYWFPAILGLIELYSYPVLMATNAWTVIGAWLGFKTVAQWKSWGDDRVTFNHYLIGNALVVLLSLSLVRYVQIAP